MDPANIPPEFKIEGPDWSATFNPGPSGPERANGQLPRQRNLGVHLMHTLLHESVVCCVRFSADGKYLATGSNRTAQIYDMRTGQKTCELIDEWAKQSGDLYIRSICFSPNGRYLVTGAEDNHIRIWDIRKKRLQTVLEGHQQEVYSLAFSRDGRFIVSGSGDDTTRIWDVSGTAGRSCKVLMVPEAERVDSGVTSVCFSPDGRLVASGYLDDLVRIWDVQTGQLVERLQGHRNSVYTVAFTPDGTGLVSGSLDRTLMFWNIQPVLRSREGVAPSESSTPPSLKDGSGGKGFGENGSQCTMHFMGHKDFVLSVAVSPDGKWVVSGSKDRGVHLWDTTTPVAQCILQGHKNSVLSVDLSPSGNVLATGSGDWVTRIWRYSDSPGSGSVEALPGLLSSVHI